MAQAQVRVPGPISTADGKGAIRGRTRSEAPPSAVPGARAEPTSVAPADRAPADMPPTEALFDAINRGDVVTAREAIGRGADIHGQNILGLTPLEQSVDLGRNDISFLLLSLRGGLGYNVKSGPRGETGAGSAAERRAEAQSSAKARRQSAAQERASRSASNAPAPSRNAHLFAGDGGAPVPQAGFLGFDSAR